MTGNRYFNHRHHHLRPSSLTSRVDHSQHWHWSMTSKVPSRIYDLEHRKQFTITPHSRIATGMSSPPLIHPFPHAVTPSPINTGPSKVHSPHPLHTEHSHIQSTKNPETYSNPEQKDRMAPKQTRVATKAKELQAEDTPLVCRLKNIKNAKV